MTSKRDLPEYKGQLTEGQVWLTDSPIEDEYGGQVPPRSVIEVLKTFDYSTPTEPVVILRIPAGGTWKRERIPDLLHVVQRRDLEAQELVWDPPTTRHPNHEQ